MKIYILILNTACLLLIASASNAVVDEVIYVQPYRAKIFAKPSIASDVLDSVDSGYQFVSSGKDGIWIKLIYEGKQGFIPAAQVARTPPLGKNVVQGLDNTPKLNARARTSTTTAVVAGMKGLTYEDRARITKGERSDFDALDKVDALKITQEELDSFQREGGRQ